MKAIIAALLILLQINLVYAAPAKKTDQPIGNPNAPQGGTFYQNLMKEPTTLNFFAASDLYSDIVFGYTYESLLSQHPDTREWLPALAEKWEISKDGKQFTFTLRPDVKFHDGTPMTAEDVKFSFDAIFVPEYNAAARRPYYEGLEKCEILDAHTVRFTAKEKYFRNFDSAAGLVVMPKHVFGDPTKAKKQTATIVGTGPYMLETFDRGNHIILKRNANWWGRSVPLYKGISNFDKIWFRYQSQDNLMLEMVKKGDLDFLDETAVTPEVYFKKAGGPEWGKTVFKEKVENQSPRSWIFIGWNLRSPIFSDKNTRVAMAYLMNRPFMIEKFRYNMSVPATGPWPYSSEYASPKVKAIPFDPKMAEQLLAKAGWSDSNHDGVLDKMIDGKLVDFRFTLIYGNPNNEKYYTLYKEDLRKSGIVMDMKIVEWNTLTKLVADEHKFDAFAMGWGAGGVDIDPKQIWHSKSQGSNGSNFIGYQNLEVDKLIDQGRQELDKKKRIKIMRAIYEKIAADAPYLFMFNDKYVTYIHTARMKSPKPTYKFGINTDAWWIQP